MCEPPALGEEVVGLLLLRHQRLSVCIGREFVEEHITKAGENIIEIRTVCSSSTPTSSSSSSSNPILSVGVACRHGFARAPREDVRLFYSLGHERQLCSVPARDKDVRGRAEVGGGSRLPESASRSRFAPAVRRGSSSFRVVSGSARGGRLGLICSARAGAGAVGSRRLERPQPHDFVVPSRCDARLPLLASVPEPRARTDPARVRTHGDERLALVGVPHAEGGVPRSGGAERPVRRPSDAPNFGGVPGEHAEHIPSPRFPDEPTPVACAGQDALAAPRGPGEAQNAVRAVLVEHGMSLKASHRIPHLDGVVRGRRREKFAIGGPREVTDVHRVPRNFVQCSSRIDAPNDNPRVLRPARQELNPRCWAPRQCKDVFVVAFEREEAMPIDAPPQHNGTIRAARDDARAIPGEAHRLH
mmetsp:Transcript_15876/g.52043  ORF Transcript_15876/g.52043 Transcript_15876/m.52043 type:complete len:416 (-) Transcript_15876:1561-2808(-)